MKLVLAVVGAVLAMFSVGAWAAVPTGVDVAYTAILTDATTLSGYVAPVVIGVLGLLIVFKLIKRFGNKI